MGDYETAATALRCKECERTGELTAAYVCEYCFGPLEVLYDMERVAATVSRERIAAGPHSLWRYRDFLPCSPDDPTAGLPSGMTPLVRTPRLAEALGLNDVWVKNDTANPTHSFKDRVVSVALEKAKQLGYEVVACASTGNLANSVAAHASAHGLESYVFVPAEPRGAEDRGDGGLRHDPARRRGQLRRRQPALHGDRRATAPGPSSTSTCARTTARARRRSPTRSPSSSAGACPTAASCRSPPARSTPRSTAASATCSRPAWSRATCRC